MGLSVLVWHFSLYNDQWIIFTNDLSALTRKVIRMRKRNKLPKINTANKLSYSQIIMKPAFWCTSIFYSEKQVSLLFFRGMDGNIYNAATDISLWIKKKIYLPFLDIPLQSLAYVSLLFLRNGFKSLQLQNETRF